MSGSAIPSARCCCRASRATCCRRCSRRATACSGSSTCAGATRWRSAWCSPRKGYPGEPARGSEIKGLDQAAADPLVTIFHAGTRREDGRLLADGGRVLNVVARGKSVAEAQRRAYAAVDRIDWPGGFCRRDIGWRAV